MHPKRTPLIPIIPHLSNLIPLRGRDFDVIDRHDLEEEETFFVAVPVCWCHLRRLLEGRETSYLEGLCWVEFKTWQNRREA